MYKRQAVHLFGEVFAQHNKRFSLADCPQIHYLSNEDHHSDGNRYIPGAGFHTDHSNAPEPPKATVLFARSLPETGGDTQFVNMYSAYADLSDEIKLKIADLKAVHVYQSRHSARKLIPLSEESQKDVLVGVVHPLVRTHPETERKALYINITFATALMSWGFRKIVCRPSRLRRPGAGSHVPHVHSHPCGPDPQLVGLAGSLCCAVPAEHSHR